VKKAESPPEIPNSVPPSKSELSTSSPGRIIASFIIGIPDVENPFSDGIAPLSHWKMSRAARSLSDSVLGDRKFDGENGHVDADGTNKDPRGWPVTLLGVLEMWNFGLFQALAGWLYLFLVKLFSFHRPFVLFVLGNMHHHVCLERRACTLVNEDISFATRRG
jgi:hypothetical protein